MSAVRSQVSVVLVSAGTYREDIAVNVLQGTRPVKMGSHVLVKYCFVDIFKMKLCPTFSDPLAERRRAGRAVKSAVS